MTEQESNVAQESEALRRVAEPLQRGDTVRLRDAAEWRQPFTVAAEYHTGTYRLEDTHGAPVVSVKRDRVEVAR